MVLDLPVTWERIVDGFLHQEVAFALLDKKTAADYTYPGSGLFMQARAREEITCQVGTMVFAGTSHDAS